MASTINSTSSGSGGLISTGDDSGQLELQTDGTTRLTIDSSGNATFAGDVSVTGSLSTTGGIPTPLVVKGNSTAGSEIRLPEDTDNGSNYVALKAANSIASNVTFTLPSADGTANQVLQTNGSGTLSFTTVSGGAVASQVFTSSGTFTIPTGKTAFKVTVVGAGGGGGGGSGTGGTGGASSIASGTQTITTVTGNGGVGGAGGNAGNSGGAGGTATNGDLNVSGQRGQNIAFGGQGGNTLLGFGGPASAPGCTNGAAGLIYGGGGASGSTCGGAANGGGGGGTAIKWLACLTPGNTITVTVGTGGAGGSTTGRPGGAGAAGVVVFEWV